MWDENGYIGINGIGQTRDKAIMTYHSWNVRFTFIIKTDIKRSSLTEERK
jgi:hypothetical protein